LTHNPVTGELMENLREKTIAKHQLIKDLGYNLISIKECVYIKLKNSNELESYIKNIITNYNY
jgi:hypothetical protein